MDLGEQGVIATKAIKEHVVETPNFVQKVVASTDAMCQAVVAKESLNRELAAEKINVDSLEEVK